MNWTREKLERFKRRYAAALKAHKASFKFENHDFLVDYARYLIEYLETQLDK